MYRYGQRCDACVWPHGLSAAPLRCCSAWCSPSELLLICYWSLYRCALQLCSLIDLCAAFAKRRTRLCYMHCRSICTLTCAAQL